MRTMKVDDKYRILMDDSRFPIEVRQAELDYHLTELKSRIEDLIAYLHDMYDTDSGIEQIIEEVMASSMMDYSCGHSWKLDNLVHEIEGLQSQLQEDCDDVPSVEDIETIEDYGFHNFYDRRFYEKVLEDTEEKEVVEEIVLKYNPPLYRKRTTIWEKTDYGRTSKQIIYEDLILSDDMLRLIRNLKREIGESF